MQLFEIADSKRRLLVDRESGSLSFERGGRRQRSFDLAQIVEVEIDYEETPVIDLEVVSEILKAAFKSAKEGTQPMPAELAKDASHTMRFRFGTAGERSRYR